RHSFVWSCVVAPRAYWKGYLKLSLVSCPVALFPASSEREKISFNQINKKIGNRIRYRKVDAETGDEVDSSDIIKGYEVGKGQYIEIARTELEAIAIESKRTIEIDDGRALAIAFFYAVGTGIGGWQDRGCSAR